MQIVETSISGLVVIEPRVFSDQRGYFFESYNKSQLPAHIQSVDFVQDNEAYSHVKGVLRGLHYQIPPFDQAKLVRVVEGEVLDVVVDIRENSKTFGESYTIKLTADNKKQLFVPRGFAHGYIVLSEAARFSYKCDNYYSKAHEGGILYNDPKLHLDWLIPASEMILSEKVQILPTIGQHRRFQIETI